jgi:hypothetical protein
VAKAGCGPVSEIQLLRLTGIGTASRGTPHRSAGSAERNCAESLRAALGDS